MQTKTKAQLIQSSTISLGAVHDADVEAICRWKNDTELCQLMTALPLPVSREQTLTWLHSTQGDRTQVLFGIHEAHGEDSRLIGIVRFMFIDWVSGVAEFGIYIGPPDLRGNSRGRQALAKALEHGFRQLNFHKIWLRVLASNQPAIKLYSSFGFREEGTLQKHFFASGEHHDLKVMALLQADYQG